MSKVKVGIGIPSPDLVDPTFAINNLTEIVSYTRKNLPDVELYIRTERGVRTDRNRNAILTDFIEEDVDYVLWLDCMVGNTPLMVRQNGFIDFVEIQELIPESERGVRSKTYSHVPFEVMTKDGWQRINAVRQIRTSKKITRISGDCVFSATSDHRVFVNGEEKFVADLSVGDVVDKSDHIEDNNYQSWTNVFAEMAGFFMAEGSSNKYDDSYQWYLCNSNKEYLEKYSGVIEGFFGERTYIVSDTSHGIEMYKLYASNQKVMYSFFRKHFYSADGNKKVPRQILNSSKDIIQSFLSGFVLGDGYIDDRGRISIAEKSNIGMAGLTYLYKRLGQEVRFHIRDDKNTIQGFLTQNRRKPGINKILDAENQEWVYDINTDSGTFVGGVGDVIFHNCDMVYPADIIERYMELPEKHEDPFIIGCLYFQRSEPHKPIGYMPSNDPKRPFRPLMPQLIEKGVMYEVAGLGYGGMFVDMRVYDGLKDKKWTKYGDNFHNPHAESGNLTHDLVFCTDVREAGYKVFLHGSVRPGHIGTKLITQDDFFEHFPPRLLDGLRVLVAIPATDMELAEKTARVMKRRAGYACDVVCIEDKKRVGLVKTINHAFRKASDNYDFFVYTAQDAFVGNNWLANALLQHFKVSKAGLVCFNNGRWTNGELAAFGMVEVRWAKNNYDGDLFYPEYNSHYADTELTQLAKQDDKYTFAKDSIMLEIDYKKDFGGTSVNKDDKKLYNQRKHEILSEKLAEEFS